MGLADAARNTLKNMVMRARKRAVPDVKNRFKHFIRVIKTSSVNVKKIKYLPIVFGRIVPTVQLYSG